MTRKARGERDIGVNVGGLDLIVSRRRVGNTGGGSSPVQSSQPCRMAKAFLHCKLLLVRFVPGIALLLARQGKCRGRPGIYCMSIEQNIVFTRFN